MDFSIWRSAAAAKAGGFTHHAMFFGILPGYVAEVIDSAGQQQIYFMPVSDLLYPIEFVLEVLSGGFGSHFYVGAEL